MKKSMKKSKKIIILSVVLLAFFCVNAFKSAHFSPVPTVSAEDEPSRVLQQYELEDLQINNVYEPCYNGVLKWADFQITGQGSFTVDEKIVLDINGSGINAVLSNYYNNINGQYGEAVNITAATELLFDAIGLDSYLLAVMDFYDNQKNTTDYIFQCINVNLNPKIAFKDISINGDPFPTNKNDPNIERYSFGGVSLYKVTNSVNTRKSTFQPFVYGFNEKTGYNSYTSRNAFLLFANVSMYDYDPNRDTLYKFNTLVGQISTIQYGSESVAPAQQFISWYNENTTYKVSLSTPIVDSDFDYYVVFDNGNKAYFVTGGDVLYIPNTEVPQTSTLVTTDTLIFDPEETIEIKEYIGGDSINLLKTNVTNYELVTSFLADFHAMVLVDTYTPAPEPEPDPEPEPEPEPEIDYNKIVERASDKAKEYGSWVGLIGLTLGPGAAFIATLVLGADATLYGVGFEGGLSDILKEAGKVIIDFITHPIEWLKAFFYSVGAVIRGILETIKNTAFGGNNLLFIITLVVVGLIFIGRDGGIIYYIKNKKE